MREILVGSVVAAVLASLLSILKDLFDAYVRPQLFCELSVRPTDGPYDAVLALLVTKTTPVSLGALSLREKALGFSRKQLRFVPGAGAHVVRYRGELVWAQVTAGKPLEGGHMSGPSSRRGTARVRNGDALVLSARAGALDALKALVADAVAADQADTGERVAVYRRKYGRWEAGLTLAPRAMDTVVLADGAAERLVADAEDFLGNQAWYEARGIPWRRGYLLHGPPGCGKTSTAAALAARLRLNIALLTFDANMNDGTLTQLLQGLPLRSLVLLEDVDAVFVQRESRGRGGVSFSGLLNALDGVASGEAGRIVLMTTNHVERLDPALVRPGRVDLQVRVGLATREQLGRLFDRFFASAAHRERFLAAVPADRLAPATVQGHLYTHREDVEAAVARAGDMLDVSVLAAAPASIDEWLMRLGLPQYGPHFRLAGLRSAADVMGGGVDFESLGIESRAHRLRLEAMVARREDAVAGFAKVTREQARAMCPWPERKAAFADAMVRAGASVDAVAAHLLRFADDGEAAVRVPIGGSAGPVVDVDLDLEAMPLPEALARLGLRDKLAQLTATTTAELLRAAAQGCAPDCFSREQQLLLLRAAEGDAEVLRDCVSSNDDDGGVTAHQRRQAERAAKGDPLALRYALRVAAFQLRHLEDVDPADLDPVALLSRLNLAQYAHGARNDLTSQLQEADARELRDDYGVSCAAHVARLRRALDAATAAYELRAPERGEVRQAIVDAFMARLGALEEQYIGKVKSVHEVSDLAVVGSVAVPSAEQGEGEPEAEADEDLKEWVAVALPDAAARPGVLAALCKEGFCDVASLSLLEPDDLETIGVDDEATRTRVAAALFRHDNMLPLLPRGVRVE